ncbi:hypothetical protein Poli38472_006123 [Pythium oligandrum]|uniref:Uncharacterized protein n=1 Tax=Pythium oligandrum TaxID=41045 RepID=A0A8K1FLV1_PYTOL|nr:hypothetical protein Poli38472_006123 [Pythium oligandrum]|eukprot:TMW68655.1 hypothetical protein Poli38472_006123 [Pythium oligandrum]
MDPYFHHYLAGYSNEAWLVRRRLELEHEQRRLEARRRSSVRQSRQKAIFEQAKQIEEVLTQIEERQARTAVNHNGRNGNKSQFGQEDQQLIVDTQNGSVQEVLLRVVQQNIELQRLLMGDKMPTFAPESPDSSTTLVHQLNTAIEDVTRDPMPTPFQESTSFSPCGAVEDLPALDWTEEDEKLLEKLSTEATEDMNLTDESLMHALSPASNLTEEFKKRDRPDIRHESRKRLLQQLQSTASSGLRRPQWRIAMDIENGVVKPFEEGDKEEQPMSMQEIFRSGGIAVMATIELRRLVLQSKLAERSKITQDIQTMLNVYFDATRLWLSKLVKPLVLSLLQDQSLDIDVSVKSGFLTASKGLSKKFGAVFARRSATTSTSEHLSKCIKLRVRTKGLIDVFVRAIDKWTVPKGMQEFWTRFTADGVYFPESYPLFDCERQLLGLDSLGATREMHLNDRAEILLVNFIWLRVLIAQVLLQPWESGVAPTRELSKLATANLKSIATLLYLIMMQRSRLPPVGSVNEQRSAFTRRSSDVRLDRSQLGTTDDAHEPPHTDSPFVTLKQLHALLIPDKLFAVAHEEDMAAFVEEQQQRLHDAMTKLLARLRTTSGIEAATK